MPYEPKRAPLDPCPVEAVVGLIGGRWKARLLLLLSRGPARLAELRREMPRAKPQALIGQLERMARDGLVSIEPVRRGESLARIYSLTPLGLSMLPALDAVAAWGEAYLEAQGEAAWWRPEAVA